MLLSLGFSAFYIKLLAATGVPDTQAPSPGAAADEGVGPALPGYSELIYFRVDRLDLLVVQGTLKSLLQHHSSKA